VARGLRRQVGDHLAGVVGGRHVHAGLLLLRNLPLRMRMRRRKKERKNERKKEKERKKERKIR
jgi:hypothetical protein